MFMRQVLNFICIIFLVNPIFCYSADIDYANVFNGAKYEGKTIKAPDFKKKDGFLIKVSAAGFTSDICENLAHYSNMYWLEMGEKPLLKQVSFHQEADCHEVQPKPISNLANNQVQEIDKNTVPYREKWLIDYYIAKPITQKKANELIRNAQKFQNAKRRCYDGGGGILYVKVGVKSRSKFYPYCSIWGTQIGREIIASFKN